MGISINALSRDLSVLLNRVSEIVNGKRSITVDTALHFGKYSEHPQKSGPTCKTIMTYELHGASSSRRLNS